MCNKPDHFGMHSCAKGSSGGRWELASRREVVLWKSKTQLYSLQEEIAG